VTAIWWFPVWAFIVVYLSWRVWRLESRLEAFDMALAQKASCAWVSDALNENLSRCVAGTEQRVKSLAHALGYEWKRTEAKEGWERKSVFADGPWQRKLMGEYLWNNGDDRRKADRRKPEIAVKQWCSDCDAKNAKRAVSAVEREINRPAKKKPRRATH